jgi:S1-C subfamily serine protease
LLKKFILAALVAAALLFYPTASAQPGDVGKYLLLEKAPQILKLTPPSREDTGATGFQLRMPSGQVLTVTNAHVCAMAENGLLRAWVPGTTRAMLIRVLEASKTADLCLAEGLAGASGLALASDQGESERLYAVGHPYLRPIVVSSGYLVGRTMAELMAEDIADEKDCVGPRYKMKRVRGFLGEIEMCVELFDSYDTSIPIYPGNSGSPIFNARGEVVGVAFAADGRTAHGLIVPLDVVREFISIY